jgi:IS30 family transposase
VAGRRFSGAQRAQVQALAAQGYSVSEVARRVGLSWWGVRLVLAPGADRRQRAVVWCPSPARLSAVDREEIRAGLIRGETFTAIAVRLGRSVSTVSREVAHNGGRGRYRAVAAHRRAGVRARRPKPAKLAGQPVLAGQVEAWLNEAWSPQQIARRLRWEFPHDPMMWVSHETIYQSLFVQGRGALRRELTVCLRTKRAARRPRSRLERGGAIPNMVMISERPAEVADRAVPGHWEGDLVRHEALLDRAVMKGHRRRVVAATWPKLRAA